MKKLLTFGIMFLFFLTSVIPGIGVEKLSNDIYADDILIIKPKIVDDFSSTPLFFTENKGQFPNEVLFQTHISGATVYFCQNKLVSVFTQELEDSHIEERDNNQIHRNRMRLKESQQHEIISIVAEFVDANPDTVVIGEHPLPHKNNYFIGNNPAQWYIDVPNYESIIYQDIYPGIDLIYYGSDGLFKYDFIVQPGANPTQIAIQYHGADNIHMTPEGDLKITTRLGSIYEEHPVIYQKIDSKQQHVTGNYLLNDDIFSFIILEPYNLDYPLIIDPGLMYSTYLGGSENDWGFGIAVDDSGSAYVTGGTTSTNFPMQNPYDGIHNGTSDVFVTKFSPQGDTLIYSTFLGGNDDEYAFEIAVDSSECAYITGPTSSSDFPTVNAFDDTFNGIHTDAFVTKLSSQGNTLIYSTYLGGNDSEPIYEGADFSSGIAVDNNGCAYVTGWTFCYDFPVQNPYDATFNGGDDVFLTKFSPQGDTLIYSTYLGGPWPDECDGGLAVDNNGCAYLTGLTYEDFPIKNAYDDTPNGEEDAFVTKFSPQGNTLEYSTYLGGNGEEWSWDIVVDSSGSAYVTGLTRSSDFPTVNAFDDSFNGGYCDVYVTRFSSEGTTVEYSTYLGGIESDRGIAIAVDNSGSAYVTGHTESSDFPVANSYDGSYNGDSDAFVTKLAPDGTSLMYSTYLGGNKYDFGHGITVGDNGYAYVTGYTQSTDFPMVNPYDDTYNGGEIDLFLTKFPEDGGSNAPSIPERPSGQTNGRAGQEYTFTSVTSDPQGDEIYYLFDWGEGNDSDWIGPYASGEQGSASYIWEKGSYNIRVKAKDVNGDVSGWSEPLSVSMPMNQQTNSWWFLQFLQNHPRMFPILRHFLRLT